MYPIVKVIIRRLMEAVAFFGGLFLMAIGIVSTFQAKLGAPAWEVFNYGLYNVFGWTIGTWSQIVGLTIIVSTSLIDKKLPSIGSILNMIFLGMFVDFVFRLGFIPIPHFWLWQYTLLLFGIIVIGLGTGLYIAASWGAGPRDQLMLLTSKLTGRSIRFVKTAIEIIVLVIGFLLGGPVAAGTFIFSLIIGPIMQFSIVLCKQWMQQLPGRGVQYESIDQREIRPHHHDGISSQVR